jgi:hypothetical protein
VRKICRAIRVVEGELRIRRVDRGVLVVWRFRVFFVSLFVWFSLVACLVYL